MKLHAAFALGLLVSCTPASAFLLRSSQPRLAALPVPGGMSVRRGPCASSLSPAFAQIKGRYVVAQIKGRAGLESTQYTRNIHPIRPSSPCGCL